MQSQLVRKINDQIESHPDEIADIHDFHRDQFERYYDFHPKFFHNSTLLTLYSFFEYNLKTICNLLKAHKNYNLTVDDLSGNNYISKSKKYLKLIAKISVDNFDDLWRQIEDYQKNRNSIVHNNSCIIRNSDSLERQPLYQIIKKSEYLELNVKDGTFKISHYEYLMALIDLISKYITGIVREIKNQNKTSNLS